MTRQACSSVSLGERTGAVASERGAGAVTVLLTVFATLALLSATMALGTATVAAARAGAAADLAALAAADAVRGLISADPCAVASDVAGRHHAAVTECTPSTEGTVLVRTRYASPLPWPADGVSRAGPPSSAAGP